MSDVPLTAEPHPFVLESYVASDGVRLAIHRFRPATKTIRGTILSLHGIQSHAGWYGGSSSRLAEAGWDVWLLDRRGSGISAGDRGHAPHWERLTNDVVAILNHIRDQGFPGPVVLQAVSWGGKLAATVAARRADLVDALALLYPGIHARIRPRLRQRLLLALADFLGIRRRPVLIPLNDAALFTSDRVKQQFLREDPLSLRAATTGFLIADRQLSKLAQQSGPQIHCPTLLMLAGLDRIIDNDAMRGFFKTIAAKDKRLVDFPDAAHTLEFEACFEPYIASFLEWLQQREKSPGVATPGH